MTPSGGLTPGESLIIICKRVKNERSLGGVDVDVGRGIKH